MNTSSNIKKLSLRKRILRLAQQPSSIYLDTEDFCNELGLAYPRYRNYVKALRFHPTNKQPPEMHHRLPDGKLVKCHL